ncbi:MAG: hypothetical protein V2A77_10300 [Pseudomonadota bacterium]
MTPDEGRAALEAAASIANEVGVQSKARTEEGYPSERIVEVAEEEWGHFPWANTRGSKNVDSGRPME